LPFLSLRHQILKKAQAALPIEAQNLSSAALEAPDLNAVSLGKKHMFTAAGAIVWDEFWAWGSR
jgi:hypothetical protein